MDATFSLNVDTFIFTSFLIITIVSGLFSSRKIMNLKTYAIGNKDFNTGSIVATLVATFISGGVFNSYIVETYNHGLYFIAIAIGEMLGLVFLGWYFAPRMAHLIGKISIADAMGEMYGNKARIVTVFCGIICTTGIIAIQFKIAGVIFEYVFHLPPLYGVLLAGGIVTLYSAFGGIKSVVYTDILQAITFCVIIPLFAYYVFSTEITLQQIQNTLANNEHYNLEKVFDFKSVKTWEYIVLFIYYLIPIFNPAFFQRIAMAKNWQQIRTSFYVTACVATFLILSISWLGLVLVTKNPSVESSDIIKTLIYDALPSGWKGILLIGVLAMIMSTADSCINSSSVLIAYDFCKVLKIRLRDDLRTARIVSFIIGAIAIFMSLKQGSIFEIGLFFLGFYFPIVVPSFMLSLVGYQTPYEKAVLWGMLVGGTFMISWRFFDITTFDPSVFAMLANVFTIIVMHKHYLFKDVTAQKFAQNADKARL